MAPCIAIDAPAGHRAMTWSSVADRRDTTARLASNIRVGALGSSIEKMPMRRLEGIWPLIANAKCGKYIICKLQPTLTTDA